jgi:cyclohexadienyl dehydratase
MSGITVRPERSLAGNFSVPVATSGAVALVPAASSIRHASDLDRTGLRIAVNAGGHLERTARQHFPRATIQAIPDNAAVMDALAEGRADAVITDTQEAPHWRTRVAGLRQVGPFTRDRKAWLVGAERPDLAADLDAWLVDRERGGQMGSWRAQYLAESGEDAGTPRPVLSALLAAIAERLALMPLVAEAKRDSQSPVEVPERERRVLDAALARVRAAEAEADRPPGTQVPADAVRALFGAQIEAAKAIQRRILAGPRPPGSPAPPALDSALRPALLRIGDRIAWLVVRLPRQIPDAEILARSQRELAALGLSAPLVDELAAAIMGVRPASAP